MCTVTWAHSANGYELFCNRDEKRSRRTALLPRVHLQNGVNYAAPVDPEFGGTWIGVNQYGVAMTLLNRYPTGSGLMSRGLLLNDLLDSESLEEAAQRLWARDLSCFGSFTTAIFEKRKSAFVLTWDGSTKRSIEAANLLTSSSFDQEGAERARLAALGRTRRMEAFHTSHANGPSAYSPCMHRPDAETVSFTRIAVKHNSIEMFYSPDAPCRQKPGVLIRL